MWPSLRRLLKDNVIVRRPFLAFLVLVNRASCDSADMSSKTHTGDQKINVNNGLLLYYHQYSFYSQKVVMALHEKNLPFDSNIVDITNGDQYQPWFLQINPRGEVPVLQDTGKIIPDSNRIIDYLEDNFSNSDTPRLIPMDQGPEVRQRVTYFRNIMDKLPANVITIGSFYHTDLVGSPKIPFIAPVRRALVNSENKSSETLRKNAELNPDAKQMLLEKADVQDKKHQTVLNKEEYIKLLDQVEDVLSKVEEELSKHVDDKKDWWLCTDRFTVADIALTILLERLNQVGLEQRFWTDGKKPHVERYYSRVQERDSYKKTIPSTWFLVKTIFVTQAPLIIGVGVATAVALIIGGVFVVRKWISK